MCIRFLHSKYALNLNYRNHEIPNFVFVIKSSKHDQNEKNGEKNKKKKLAKRNQTYENKLRGKNKLFIIRRGQQTCKVFLQQAQLRFTNNNARKAPPFL